MDELKIDGKWSVTYDPENNDQPVSVSRYGEVHHGGALEGNNLYYAMFHALLEAREQVAELSAAETEYKARELDFARKMGALEARAEAAEKHLASAKEVIVPFSDQYRKEMSERTPGLTYAKIAMVLVTDLRAAAEWMEKGDE